ncbi:hypothetical protein ONE63_003958 [Megalurothrips usitatus]|uniref:SRCR domain-containing protein n=1 Tax=Megalurothrips usitatus TaxID=439358 RepID=A0AAV7X4N9_9NEOP|nr:hypothetical protein ONE63_003958 [Megalurothrips usitatus]
MKTHPTNVTSTPTRTAPPPAKSNVTRNSTTATKPGSTSTKSAAKPTRPSTGAAQPAKPMAVSANKAAANSTKSAPAPAGSKPPASSSKTSSSTTNTALPSSNKSAAAKPATPRPATQSTKTAAKTTAKPSAAANKTTTKSTSATTPARTTPRPTSTSPPPTTAPPTTPTPTTAKPVLEPSALEKTEAQRNRTAQLVAAIRAAVGLPAKSVSSSSTKLAANAVDAALPHKVLHKAPAGASTPSATTTPSPGGTLPTSTGAPLREDGNATDCGVRCGDGSCVAAVSRCNQLVDCQDGADERGCTCADYLRAKFMHRKLCDGVVDCWDYSDESNCDWCEPGRYVCTSSRVCVETSRLCDGQRDCPYGDDERQCVSVAPDVRAADDLVYHSEGLVMVRRQGVWGKLCAKGIVGQGPQPTAASAAVPLWGPLQLGEVICRALTFSGVETARLAADDDPGHDVAPYFETGSNITDEKR